MSLPEEESFIEKRARLAAEISRQRGELSDAYLKLEKPIRYTEYGMRGFGFLRQNPWVVAAVPAVFSLVSSFFGGKKKGKSAPSAEMSQSQDKSKLGKAKQVLAAGVRHGWQLYQLYRRVRTLIP